MADSDREQFVAAARLLRPMLDELVFVGGAVTGLLITDEGAASPRVTLAVDAVAAIPSYAAYAALGERLRRLGFREDDSEGAPLCRWIQSGTVLDVMPLDESVLGFSNRWYRAALETAVYFRLTDEIEIRLITAPVFVATRIEAFRGRGGGDFFSHDLEDVIAVVDGRESLVGEIQTNRADLSRYLRDEIRDLLKIPRFRDALPGFLLPDAVSQSRLVTILRRLDKIASLPRSRT